jgi:hypothetical protein
MTKKKIGLGFTNNVVVNKVKTVDAKYSCYYDIISILGVAVFFGYKLYRSLADKERKREDKRKVKSQKKKK